MIKPRPNIPPIGYIRVALTRCRHDHDSPVCVRCKADAALDRLLERAVDSGWSDLVGVQEQP